MLLNLFLTFLQIGTFSFGGGYGMLSLMREKVLANGWLTEEELLNMIAVSESTPGPIAVNMATFIGSSKAGVLGSIVATLGVILPAFIIILLIATVIKNLLKYAGVQAFLGGIRPCVVGLILATSVTLGLGTCIGFSTVSEVPTPDVRAIIILALIFIISAILKRILKKKPSPILMIIISAALGIILYSIK